MEILVSFGFGAAAAAAVKVVEPRVRQMERRERSCIFYFVCFFGWTLEYDWSMILCVKQVDDLEGKGWGGFFLYYGSN